MFRDSQGDLHETKDGARDANSSAAAASAIGGVLGVVIGPLISIIMAIPMILVTIFSVVFGALFKWGTVGRIIQSAIYGLPLGLVATIIAVLLLQIPEDASFTTMAVISVCFGIPALWYYFSHYFTLRALGQKESEEEDEEDWTINSAAHILITFVIVFVGYSTYAILALLYWFFDVKIPENVLDILKVVLGVAPAASAFIYYVVKSIGAREKAKELKKEIGSPIWGAPLAVVLTCILPLMWAKEDAESKAERAEREAKFDAARADLAGQTLKVGGKLKLHAEASGTSKALKTLNGGDTVKATGNIVNTLWVPVEAGTSKGYLYAPSVYFGRDALLEGWDVFPYEAKLTKAITVKERTSAKYSKEKSVTLKSGSEVVVLSTYKIEYLNNDNYKATIDDIESLNYVKALSREIPAEFEKASKKSPIQATVTENISIQLDNDYYENYVLVSIPKGTTVEVTGGNKYGIAQQALVTYDNHKEIEVYWKYLEPKK